MGKIQVYTLGRTGVMVDPQPFDLSLPDDALRLSRNATHDPRSARMGALRKRPGFAKFILASLGGAILGGIPMPVAGTGGAPASSSGGGGVPGSEGGTGAAPGTSSGAGDGTGAAGGTSSGGSAAYTPVGAALFNGGSSIFSGARLIVIGRTDNTVAGGRLGTGWYVTSKQVANAANSLTTPGPPGTVYSYPPTTIFTTLYGQPYLFDANLKALYYAAAHTQTAGTQSTIRKTNGAVDNLFATIPWNTASNGSAYYATGDASSTITNERQAIMWMADGPDNLIYLTVKDKASGQSSDSIATNVGRIYQLDRTTGELSIVWPYSEGVLYQAFPFAICRFNGITFWSTLPISSSEITVDANTVVNASTIAGSQFGEFQDVLISGTQNGQFGSCFLAFPAADPTNQRLYMGFGCNQTTPVFPQVFSRDRQPAGTASAWRAESTPLGSGGVGGAGPVNGQYWVNFAEFNGKLYASYYNPGTYTAIFQFTPIFNTAASDGHWDGSGTWAMVYHNSGTVVPFRLFADSGVIYAFGWLAPGSSHLALQSVDGSSWNDVSGNIGQFSNQSYPLPIFAGFDQ